MTTPKAEAMEKAKCTPKQASIIAYLQESKQAGVLQEFISLLSSEKERDELMAESERLKTVLNESRAYIGHIGNCNILSGGGHCTCYLVRLIESVDCALKSRAFLAKQGERI